MKIMKIKKLKSLLQFGKISLFMLSKTTHCIVLLFSLIFGQINLRLFIALTSPVRCKQSTLKHEVLIDSFPIWMTYGTDINVNMLKCSKTRVIQ